MNSDYIKQGVERAPNRSLLYALGYTDEEISRPLIGVVSSHNEIVPGHMDLDKIAEAVKAGVRAAGGTPVMFPAIAVCDGIAMGHIGMKYSLVTRDLIAVEQDASGKCQDIALAYIAGIGGARAGIMETTMHEEAETDLFGEQCVICGGVADLMRCGFETLVEAGYEPENAYFECIHEMKLIVDLINKGGIAAMNYSISDTAEYGEYVSGPRVLPYEQTKANMRAVLSDIQDGTFAGRWIAENKNGRTFFNSKREQLAKHPMEVIGKQLREQMLWKNDSDLDTASN